MEPRVPQNLTYAAISPFVVNKRAVGHVDHIAVAKDSRLNLDTVEKNAVAAVVVTQNTIGSPHCQERMAARGAIGSQMHTGIVSAAHDAFARLKNDLPGSTLAIDLFQ